jgi:hypothetical protein
VTLRPLSRIGVIAAVVVAATAVTQCMPFPRPRRIRAGRRW